MKSSGTRRSQAHLERDVGGLQDGGGPSPLGHDDGGDQPGLDVAAGSVEPLRALTSADIAALQPHEPRGENGEEGTEAEHDDPTPGDVQGGDTAEEGRLELARAVVIVEVR